MDSFKLFAIVLPKSEVFAQLKSCPALPCSTCGTWFSSGSIQPFQNYSGGPELPCSICYMVWFWLMPTISDLFGWLGIPMLNLLDSLIHAGSRLVMLRSNQSVLFSTRCWVILNGPQLSLKICIYAQPLLQFQEFYKGTCQRWKGIWDCPFNRSLDAFASPLIPRISGFLEPLKS